MQEKNMTALVSCFARAYHYESNKYKIFSDNLAKELLTQEEYQNISKNMEEGISFFNKDFTGTKEEALRWIVNENLSPQVLGRSAFCESSLKRAISLGTHQYLLFASGYDTFAYRYNKNNLTIFEIDTKTMIEDKIKRLQKANLDYHQVNYIKCDFTKDNLSELIMNSNYQKDKLSFSSLLGLTYYLTKEDFTNLINSISKLVLPGSTIVFDYPNKETCSKQALITKLANSLNENMLATYTYQDIEEILSNNDFLIYEHLNSKELTNNYFDTYNTLNPNNKIIAPTGVSYCLAVKNPKHKK